MHRWPSGRRGLRSIGVVDRGGDGYVRVLPAWDRDGGFTAEVERVQALLAVPGAILLGCSAGLVNVPRIKGSHNAMKTGMMAADAAYEAVQAGRAGDELVEYQAAFEKSWVYKELSVVRNAKPLLSKFGTTLGGALGMFDMWCRTLLGGGSPIPTLQHGKTDAAATRPAQNYRPIDYPKPDGKLSFDRLTNVAFSFTNHEESQPCHLKLKDPTIPIRVNLPEYAEPAQRYCPAGVYEFVKTDAGGERSLPGLNLRTAGESGWQYHVQVSGAGASLEHLRGEQLGVGAGRGAGCRTTRSTLGNRPGWWTVGRRMSGGSCGTTGHPTRSSSRPSQSSRSTSPRNSGRAAKNSSCSCATPSPWCQGNAWPGTSAPATVCRTRASSHQKTRSTGTRGS